MTNRAKYLSLLFTGAARPAALVSVLLLTLTLVAALPARAQTYSDLFNYSLQSGWQPYSGLTRDRSGSLYGTTTGGGVDAGTVYQLKRSDGHWIMNPLFKFNPISLPSDDPVGWWPWSGVVFGPDGALYGTTFGGGAGGGSSGYGVVYKLTPPASACKTALCYWTETVLYEFAGGTDGANPLLGNVTFDSNGNLYGTTGSGGAANAGTVYELTPAGGVWTEKVLYSFAAGQDGAIPYSSVAVDQAGNLYGTTSQGGGSSCNSGKGCGTVYELSNSGGVWTEKILYAFQGGNDGWNAIGGVIFDQAGNLYGSANMGGSAGGGTVFELSPSGGNWTFAVLHALGPDTYDLGGPLGNLVLDGAGSIYGTTDGDGTAGVGTVFKLTPHSGGWNFTTLYNFAGGNDGVEPVGGPIVDSFGNVYGTTSEGGVNGCEFEVQCGLVWEITPN